jgi:uncharacterized YccA/Bax inhibitor family protein
MGLWMGAITRAYEFVYEGIVSQALMASVCAFLACLVLYLSRAIRVTPRLTRVIVIAVGGIILLYLIGGILSLFGVNPRFMSEPTILGIVISVAIGIMAALNRLLDFAIVEEMIEAGAPAAIERYAAFGLLALLRSRKARSSLR